VPQQVVLTKDLARELRDWLDKHNAEYRGYGSQNMMTGVKYMEEHAGLAYRSIHRILREESEYTALSLADRILTTMERPDLFHTRVPICDRPSSSYGRRPA